jgi:hypothetical protein
MHLPIQLSVCPSMFYFLSKKPCSRQLGCRSNHTRPFAWGFPTCSRSSAKQ